MLAANLVGTLLHHVRVDVRFNSDKGNAKDMLAFLDFANENGWFSKPFPAVFQPARIAAYSDKSAFMQRHQLSLEAFDALRAQARKHLPETVLIEESEVPDGYPYPKTSVCAALAEDSFVVGADGQEYRCGLQVSERHRAVGALTKSKLGSIPVVALEASGEASQGSWWAHYDPTAQTKCSRCSFLPICLGGCPKKHLENDTKALAEQCAYWRTNLPRLIGRAADTDIRAGTCYCDDDQIRF